MQVLTGILVQVVLRVCTSNKLPGDGDPGTADLWPTLGVASLEGWLSLLASHGNHCGETLSPTPVTSRLLRGRAQRQWFLRGSSVDSYLQLGLGTTAVESWPPGFPGRS